LLTVIRSGDSYIFDDQDEEEEEEDGHEASRQRSVVNPAVDETVTDGTPQDWREEKPAFNPIHVCTI